MPFLYDQISGGLWQQDSVGIWRRLTICYSGREDGLNNPNFEGVKGVGPVPCGNYTMRLVDERKLGPVVFALDPDDATDKRIKELGREPLSFRIHWDNAQRDYSASEGCIVNDGHGCVIGSQSPLTIFTYINGRIKMKDNKLTVVAQPPLPMPKAA